MSWGPWHKADDVLPDLGDWVQAQGLCFCRFKALRAEGMVVSVSDDGFDLSEPVPCGDLCEIRWRRKQLGEPQIATRRRTVSTPMPAQSWKLFWDLL